MQTQLCCFNLELVCEPQLWRKGEGQNAGPCRVRWAGVGLGPTAE